MVIKTEENQTDSIFIATYQTMIKRKKRKEDCWIFSIPLGVVVLGTHVGIAQRVFVRRIGMVWHMKTAS